MKSIIIILVAILLFMIWQSPISKFLSVVTNGTNKVDANFGPGHRKNGEYVYDHTTKHDGEIFIGPKGNKISLINETWKSIL